MIPTPSKGVGWPSRLVGTISILLESVAPPENFSKIS
jgi:hypothetical protein